MPTMLTRIYYDSSGCCDQSYSSSFHIYIVVSETFLIMTHLFFLRCVFDLISKSR